MHDADPIVNGNGIGLPYALSYKSVSVVPALIRGLARSLDPGAPAPAKAV